jgi:hypothetical protein
LWNDLRKHRGRREISKFLARTPTPCRPHPLTPSPFRRGGTAEQVQLFDEVVQYRFGDDAELMGAWVSARNVLGPFKPKEQTPGESGGQTLREAQGRPPKAA